MQIQDDKKFNNILKLFKNEGGNETTGTQTYGWTATKQNKNNMSTLFRNQHKKGGGGQVSVRGYKYLHQYASF